MPLWAQPVEGIDLHFPAEGTLNAFVIFVQHRDDLYDNDLTTDPATEWPAAWSRGPARLLPAWAGEQGEALLAPPGTPPAAFAEGSVSRFYHLMSGGRFTLTGAVYPRVYIPAHERQWYIEARGDFATGALHLSHEILTSAEVQDYLRETYGSRVPALFDRYTNGDGLRPVPDGIFDLVVLVYRLSHLPPLRGNCRPDERCGGYTSVANLGTQNNRSGRDTFAQSGAPVTLAGLQVVDNSRSGSGVIVEGYTLKRVVRTFVHEVGHRQFYLQHTCPNPAGSTNTAVADCIGIMGGPYLTLSAPDRLKLGWAEVDTLDLRAVRGSVSYELPVLGAEGSRVLRLQHGAAACGDVLVEARAWNNFWDRPPDGVNDDGDEGDFYLPQQGLYLYKASDGTARCGGPYRFASSLESGGTARDPSTGFRVGSTYAAGFRPGDAYTPLRNPTYQYHRHPDLDARLWITNITRTPRGYRFDVGNGLPLQLLAPYGTTPRPPRQLAPGAAGR